MTSLGTEGKEENVGKQATVALTCVTSEADGTAFWGCARAFRALPVGSVWRLITEHSPQEFASGFLRG